MSGSARIREDDHERAPALPVGEGLERGGVVRLLDARVGREEGLGERAELGRAAAGRDHAPHAGAEEECPDPVPAPRGGPRQGERGVHGVVELEAAVGEPGRQVPPAIDEDPEGLVPLRLGLPDDGRSPPRGGLPVDGAQVVPRCVRAQARELPPLAVAARPGGARLGRLPRGEAGEAAQVGVDPHLGGEGKPPLPRRESPRSEGPHVGVAEAVDAALARDDRVGERGRTVSRDVEARPVALRMEARRRGVRHLEAQRATARGLEAKRDRVRGEGREGLAEDPPPSQRCGSGCAE